VSKIRGTCQTAETLRIRFKFYNSGGTNVENPETYIVQVSHSGTLTPVTLKKADFEPMSFEGTEAGGKKSEKPDKNKISW
jgi:hypothetical protein